MLTRSSSFFASSEHPRTENHSLCKVKIHPTCGTAFDAAFVQQYHPTFPLYWRKAEVCSQAYPQRKNSSSRENIIEQLKQWKQIYFSVWDSSSEFLTGFYWFMYAASSKTKKSDQDYLSSRNTTLATRIRTDCQNPPGISWGILMDSTVIFTV